MFGGMKLNAYLCIVISWGIGYGQYCRAFINFLSYGK